MTKNIKYLKYPYEKIQAINPQTLKVVEIPSISSASFYGFNPKGVTEVLCGRRKTHKGWIFERVLS